MPSFLSLSQTSGMYFPILHTFNVGTLYTRTDTGQTDTGQTDTGQTSV
jgi:hypothetical protein